MIENPVNVSAIAGEIARKLFAEKAASFISYLVSNPGLVPKLHFENESAGYFIHV